MFEELANCREKVVGTKQVMRALKSGELKSVYIAQDADVGIKDALIALSREAGLKAVMVPAKKELGRLAGISVPSACAGIPCKKENRSPAGCQEI